MNKFKIEFSQALIPTLAVIMSALLVTIFSTTMNIANANSFPLSPISVSPVQLQPLHQQQDTNGMTITTNSNELRLTDNPLPFLPPPQQSQSQPSQQQQQQQMNQPTQQKQPLNANEMSDSHNNKFDNHSPTIVSILPF
jgi:hypothetical protein